LPSRARRVIRVLLVDNHLVVRIGLSTLLKKKRSIEVIGEAGTVSEAVTKVIDLKPDVVLLDGNLPDGAGAEACRAIQAACPTSRVLFLGSSGDNDSMLSTVLAGAAGVLPKNVDETRLVWAIESVASGRPILESSMRQALTARLRGMNSDVRRKDRKIALSPQEHRVMSLIAEGKTNKEIAANLGLSDHTIRNYLSHIFQKLKISRRSQAAVLFSQLSDERDLHTSRG
jgi:two-component system, NarL family, response regulator DevR